MTGPQLTKQSLLSVLSKERLRLLAQEQGIVLRSSATKSQWIDTLVSEGRLPFGHYLQRFDRSELKKACRAHSLDDKTRARQDLITRLLQKSPVSESVPPKTLFSRKEISRYLPHVGDTVRARHRQWLVDGITLPPEDGHLTRADLVCLDDDNRGKKVSLLWELEVGAKVIAPEHVDTQDISSFEDPLHFLSRLRVLRWQSVTASDRELFQSPFRAGIQILRHQLTPLQKALSLPRANLFIADDVGLGKTIEAGLILSELILRQRVDFCLVVCPASVTTQWQEEMRERFGLRFEIYSREFMKKRRAERGFGVNPWLTSNRFILSQSLLSKGDYMEPLIAALGDRKTRSLLILDEAHAAAPKSGAAYATDTKTTAAIRDLGARFENRLFLSATPHNGHSNSFSALLELLDPQRFARAVPVDGPIELEPVMVRRLKKDLKGALGSHLFPERKVIRHTIKEEGGRWTDGSGRQDCFLEVQNEHELLLASKLRDYAEIMKEQKATKAVQLSMVNLQKRLLSSPEAFYKTFRVHRRGVEEKERLASPGSADESMFGASDDLLDAAHEHEVSTQSAKLDANVAADLRSEIAKLSTLLRSQPDAKFQALVSLLAGDFCQGLNIKEPPAKPGRWKDQRLLVFTEYADTRRYLIKQLQEVLHEEDHDRILSLHGGMSEEGREEVQAAFNADPEKERCRILIATDAAREGLNLQAHCADVVHYDIPWNPSRLEQRNGRIDRALQPESEVRCHYFVYEERKEDRVLEKLVEKTEVILKELGSLGDVLLEKVEESLEPGIDEDSISKLEEVINQEGLNLASETTEQELEAIRQQEEIQRSIEASARVYGRSQKLLGFEPTQLKTVIDVGLKLSGASNLEVLDAQHDPPTYRIPNLPAYFDEALDPLRPPRKRDQSFREWRAQPPRPITLLPSAVLSSETVQLHLGHPFVKRLLNHFTSASTEKDAARAAVIPTKKRKEAVAFAFGRLSLFGEGAGRLHDEVISVSAPFALSSGLGDISKTDEHTELLHLLDHAHEDYAARATNFDYPEDKLKVAAKTALEKLQPVLRDEADAKTASIENKLRARGSEEARQLESIIQRQITAINRTLSSNQLSLSFDGAESLTKTQEKSAKQRDADKKYLQERLQTLEHEKETEPETLRHLYDVKLRRFQPIGVIFLWPHA